MAATPEQRDAFIEAMITHAAPVARDQDLPAAALVACGAIESGYGTSAIYRKTHCPYNLQKPAHYTWVHCRVTWLPTLSKMDEHGQQSGQVRAPFCTAEGETEEARLADAARIWCEWVLGWPQPGTRSEMLGLRKQALAFAKKLHRLGFGDPKVASLTAQTYENVFRDQNLIERCDAALALDRLLPRWLIGWWRVTWRGQTFFYAFDSRGGVAWTPMAPLQATAPAVVGLRDSGRVSLGPGGDLRIVWSATGTVESFTAQAVAGPPRMSGRWNGLEEIQAEKLA